MENKSVMKFSNITEPYARDIGHHPSGRKVELGELNNGSWVT